MLQLLATFFGVVTVIDTVLCQLLAPLLQLLALTATVIGILVSKTVYAFSQCCRLA